MTRARMWRQEWRLSLVFDEGDTQVSYHPTGDDAWTHLMLTIEDYGRALAQYFIVQVR